MNELETLAASEREKGWFPHIVVRQQGWTCSLYHSDVTHEKVKPEFPLPIGNGETAFEALKDAIRVKKQILAGM